MTDPRAARLPLSADDVRRLWSDAVIQAFNTSRSDPQVFAELLWERFLVRAEGPRETDAPKLTLDSYYLWMLRKIRKRASEAQGTGGDLSVLLAILDSVLKQGRIEVTGRPEYLALTNALDGPSALPVGESKAEGPRETADATVKLLRHALSPFGESGTTLVWERAMHHANVTALLSACLEALEGRSALPVGEDAAPREEKL